MPGTICIIGHLGKDAEVRKVGDGDVAKLRVGVTSGYGDRAHTSWWDVDMWGKPAEWVGKLRKGAAVTVMGELQSREYEGTTHMGIRAQTVQGHERTEPSADSKPQGTGGW
jgi:single-stranded DNA-binding protein